MYAEAQIDRQLEARLPQRRATSPFGSSDGGNSRLEWWASRIIRYVCHPQLFTKADENKLAARVRLPPAINPVRQWHIIVFASKLPSLRMRWSTVISNRRATTVCPGPSDAHYALDRILISDPCVTGEPLLLTPPIYTRYY